MMMIKDHETQSILIVASPLIVEADIYTKVHRCILNIREKFRWMFLIQGKAQFNVVITWKGNQTNQSNSK